MKTENSPFRNDPDDPFGPLNKFLKSFTDRNSGAGV